MSRMSSLANLAAYALSSSDWSEVKESFPPHQLGIGMRWIHHPRPIEEFGNNDLYCRVAILGSEKYNDHPDGELFLGRVQKHRKVKKQPRLVLSSSLLYVSQPVSSVECHLMCGDWWKSDLGILSRQTIERQIVFRCLECDNPLQLDYRHDSYLENSAYAAVFRGRCDKCTSYYCLSNKQFRSIVE